MTKLKTLLSLTLAATALASPALAQDKDRGSSSGTEGGGEVTLSDDTIRFRDLVDPGNCRWLRGKVFVPKYAPKMDDYLDSVARHHWVFSALLRRAIYSNFYCVQKGALKHINTEDADSLRVMEYREKKNNKLVALWQNGNIVINGGWFNLLHKQAPDDLYAFFAHEAMHAFMPFDMPKRNESLHRITNEIFLNWQSPVDEETFLDQLTQNGLYMPTITPSREQVGALIETLVDPRRDTEEQISALKELLDLSGSWCPLAAPYCSNDPYQAQGGWLSNYSLAPTIEKVKNIVGLRLHLAYRSGDLENLGRYSEFAIEDVPAELGLAVREGNKAAVETMVSHLKISPVPEAIPLALVDKASPLSEEFRLQILKKLKFRPDPQLLARTTRQPLLFAELTSRPDAPLSETWEAYYSECHGYRGADDYPIAVQILEERNTPALRELVGTPRFNPNVPIYCASRGAGEGNDHTLVSLAASMEWIEGLKILLQSPALEYSLGGQMWHTILSSTSKDLLWALAESPAGGRDLARNPWFLTFNAPTKLDKELPKILSHLAKRHLKAMEEVRYLHVFAASENLDTLKALIESRYNPCLRDDKGLRASAALIARRPEGGMSAQGAEKLEYLQQIEKGCKK